MFIDESYINTLIEQAKSATDEQINEILDKAERFEGLSHKEVASLLHVTDPKLLNRIYTIAGKIKEHIYGNRIVMFAPLYVSDYCVNNCKYCGYKHDNEFCRRKLTMAEVEREVRILEQMGHKRLAVEAGEDPVNCPIEYILDVLKTIYNTKFENGEIRRCNVNIAATTVENYKKLKEVGIGTYILFQETYHKETYERVHPVGPKHNYEYHTTAFDRAQQGGIDDVGGGVLFGLYDWKFEVMGLMLHNEHLEKEYGVGFHTISVPRLCKTEGMDMSEYPYIPTDDEFKRLVAIIRIAVPFTGMIISTRESLEMRKVLLNMGISQISGGSNVEVGGYGEHTTQPQFKVTDERSAIEIVKWLMDMDFVPSFCTACYRKGRTGDRFMSIAKSGNIKNVCLPNGLMTLCEYATDYGDNELKQKVERIVKENLPKIKDEEVRREVEKNIISITKEGKRDLYL